MSDDPRILYENEDMWRKEYHTTVLDRARQTVLAVPKDVRTIIDVGSGDGLITKALQEAEYVPVAFDISHHALRNIQELRRVQGDIAKLPFSANSFDLVLACELLEHIPDHAFTAAINELSKISNKYIIITVPYRENLEWNYARCPACGCIFNGAYHVRSFDKNNLPSLFGEFRCISLKGIVSVLHPNRTTWIELFIRHHLAHEYLYYGTKTKCPMCFSYVNKKPKRNLIGWIATGMRYLYRLADRKEQPLWYLAIYEKINRE